MPPMAALDSVFQRYGWDYWTYMAQPSALLDELARVWNAEAEADKVESSRRAGKTGGAGAVPTNTQDLLQQAREAGLPMPPTKPIPEPEILADDVPDGEMPA